MDKSTTNSNTSKQRATVNKAPASVVVARYPSAVGIDVHAKVLVCAFQKMQDKEIVTEFANFQTGREGLEAFTAWCKSMDPAIVVMESTGVLWRSPYEFLENAGFTSAQLALVNARDVKAVIGRKTDEEDAKRLAEIARLGNIRKSFIPERVFRDMRILARLYQKQVSGIATSKNRFHKLLNSTGCRAGSVFSDIRGKAATAIIRTLLLDPDSFDQVVTKYSRRLRANAMQIRNALAFEIPPVIREQLADDLIRIEQEEKAAERTMQRLRALQEPYQTQIDLLQTIPGIKETAARLIFAELTDRICDYFRNSQKFCSWLGICPGNKISANKSYSGASAKGNKWLRRTLVECAQAIGLSRGVFRESFNVFKLRRGTRRAVVAIAHLLARIIYAVLKSGKAFLTNRVSKSLREELTKRVVQNAKQLNRLVPSDEPRHTLFTRDTGEVLGAVPERLLASL